MVCSILLSAWYFIALGHPPVQFGPLDTKVECEAMQLAFRGHRLTACWEKASERRMLIGHGLPMQAAEEADGDDDL